MEQVTADVAKGHLQNCYCCHLSRKHKIKGESIKEAIWAQYRFTNNTDPIVKDDNFTNLLLLKFYFL